MVWDDLCCGLRGGAVGRPRGACAIMGTVDDGFDVEFELVRGCCPGVGVVDGFALLRVDEEGILS